MKIEKILMLLSNAFSPDPRVHQEASALLDAGYSVRILCWDRDLAHPRSEIIDGIGVERIYIASTHGRGSSQIFFLFLFWIKAFFSALRTDCDVIHCHDFDTLPLGFLLSKIKGAKVVYDSHESYTDMLINIPPWMKRAINYCENLLLRRVHLVITVGEILKKYLMDRGAKTCCVVGNWKDQDKFRIDPSALKRKRSELGISENQVVISFIAHLGTERQVPQLLDAVVSSPNLFLVIGGKGPVEDLVRESAARHSNIHYLGFVEPAQIPFYTALADISFYGFDPANPNARFSAPNKLFEAMAAGQPILTADFGEIGRIVKQTGCGIILKNYTSHELKNVFSSLNADKIALMASRSKTAGINQYSWQKAKRTLLDNYQRLQSIQSSGRKGDHHVFYG